MKDAAKPRKIGCAARFNGKAEGFCHLDEVSACGNGRIGHDGCYAHFHGGAGFGRLSDAGINDDGKVNFIKQDVNPFLIDKAFIGPNGGGKGHDAACAGIFHGAGRCKVREHIGHDDKILLCKSLRGLDGFCVVRKEVTRILHDLDLDKGRMADFSGKTGDAYGFVSVSGT